MRTFSATFYLLLHVRVFVSVEMNKLELGLNKVSKVRREVEEQEQNFHMLRAQKAATRMELQKKVSKNLQHQIKTQKQQYEKQNLCMHFILFCRVKYKNKMLYIGNCQITLWRWPNYSLLLSYAINYSCSSK